MSSILQLKIKQIKILKGSVASGSLRSLARGGSHVTGSHMKKHCGQKPKPPVHSYMSGLGPEPPAPVKSAETVAPAELTASLKPREGA